MAIPWFATLRGVSSAGRAVFAIVGAILLAQLAIEAGDPTGPAWAAQLERPEGRVILKISGHVANTNSSGAAEFDRAMLQTLPTETIETETPWTDGVVRFEGPLMRELLKFVGARGSSIQVTALNDYTVDIPVSDLESYHVILAMKMNGEDLQTRTRGPLWVVYPWSEHPMLRAELYYGRAVWQAREIIVKD